MNNELTTAKQILETHNLESGAKLRRQKVEASNDSSRLECEIDRLRHQLRGKFINLVINIVWHMVKRTSQTLVLCVSLANTENLT